MFFGGKGGVGKTTCAAARAVAESTRGRRVLAVSTDPAHSLGDALNVRLSARVSEVRAARGMALHAVELDAPRAFARWIAEHHDALADVLAHGTWLDRHDIDALLSLPLPGVDELVGMLEIVSLATRRRKTPRHSSDASYDLVIVDTAPTGHALRLLAAPDAVAAIAAVLDALQEEHRIIKREFGRIGRPEAADQLIDLLMREAAETRALLRDVHRTAFEWVMLPEALSLDETKDGIAALQRARIPVAEIIINRALPAGAPCALCDRRRVEESRVIAKTMRAVGKVPIRVVPAEMREPRGMKSLLLLGRSLIGSAATLRRLPRRIERRRSTPDSGRVTRIQELRSAPPETLEALRGARLLFFGGKGGVGKTTVAAAAALRLARCDPSRRVLLLSTDPAHSLGDVLDDEVGDRETPVRGGPKNLDVRELDATAALAKRRATVEAALSEVSATVGGRSSAASHLMALAPPGIDELFALLTVTALTAGDAEPATAHRARYDLIVIDTAPTGHALRLMEMPQLAREWTQLLMRVLLKYRSVVKPGQMAQEIVDLSQSIRRLQSILRDPDATRFVVVTRAADVPQLETARLMVRLRRLQLAVPALIINARTFPVSDCARCRSAAAAERRVASALSRSCRGRRCVIIQTPLVAPPPRGSRMLERWASRWIA
ncbi:MAG TPA: ArsA family ATPase [Vicinamibacterales bacterium]